MRPSTSRTRRGLQDLASAIYRQSTPLTDLRMLALGTNIAPAELPIPPADAPGWEPFAVGARWGGRDDNVWFHGVAEIPGEWRKRLYGSGYALALRLLLGESANFGWPEGLLYVNGALLQGVNQHHPDVLLPESLIADQPLTFDVRAWSGIMEGTHELKRAELALLSRDMEALYYLLAQGLDLVESLDESDPLLQPLFAALQDAYDHLDLRRSGAEALDTSANGALSALRARLASLRAAHDPADRPQVTAIGHGHLDVAWLWRTKHTREKTARTFGVATALMAQYPEYHFLHTTPQVYAWLERDYPDLFQRVRARVAEGRFEAGGAMWLESDTNLVSGESLVRQILYGQRYLRETFGAEYDTLWLPDTFGYTYALPQIMLKSGLRVFMTTKMSWSDTNRIPYDTFRWRGLDGSETLAHLVTTPWLPERYNLHDIKETVSDTYNGRLDVAATRKLWERYRSKDVNQDLLLIYGYGDGGAGPTRQMVESYRALTELPGMADVRLGRADHYFHDLRARVWDHPNLPTWDGELYLEYHRGVYTTQGWLKRLHRRNEERLLLAESLDAQRWALARARGQDAPDERATRDDAWRALLLHEFHDILPGSSIGPVYEDARRDLTALAEQLDAFIERAASTIGRLAGTAPNEWLIYNPSPLPTPDSGALLTLAPSDGQPLPGFASGGDLPSQSITTPTGAEQTLVALPEFAGRGWLRIRDDTGEAVNNIPLLANSQPTARKTDDGGAILENTHIQITLDATGAIVSFRDHRASRAPNEPEHGRELILAGQRANVFTAFDDRPKNFDAWDIDAGYERKPYLMERAEIVSIEAGRVRASARVRLHFQSSVITQDIALYAGSSRVDFITHIDWHERHLLLKVAFPLDLRVTQARSEIQYGSITRLTHRNTSWDQARFETVAHRWVDLAQTSYGVALLNDGKYGHDIHDSTIRLTILRSPTSPDPTADQGPHDVTYSLLPHADSSGESIETVIQHGYALNRPLIALPPDGAATTSEWATLEPLFSLRTVGAVSRAVIEAIKRAAEGDALIVRVYEASGSRLAASIWSSFPLTEVIETDLLERPLREGESPAYDLWRDSPVASHDAPSLNIVDGVAHGWSFALRPYEIRTFRVTLAEPQRPG